MACMFEHSTLHIFSNGAHLAKRAFPSAERSTKRQDGHSKFGVGVRRVSVHVLTKRSVIGEARSQSPGLRIRADVLDDLVLAHSSRVRGAEPEEIFEVRPNVTRYQNLREVRNLMERPPPGSVRQRRWRGCAWWSVWHRQSWNRDIHDDKFLHDLRMFMREGKRDHAADVVTDDVHSLLAENANQLVDIFRNGPFVIA